MTHYVESTDRICSTGTLSRTSRNQTGEKHPRSCAKLLDVQPIYVLANVLEQAERSVATHWV